MLVPSKKQIFVSRECWFWIGYMSDLTRVTKTHVLQ